MELQSSKTIVKKYLLRLTIVQCARLEECRIGRVQDWKGAKLEECKIGKVEDLRSVGLEECRIGRV